MPQIGSVTGFSIGVGTLYYRPMKTALAALSLALIIVAGCAGPPKPASADSEFVVLTVGSFG